MEKKKLGFGMTGSFCTWAKVLPVMRTLTEEFEVFPILSEIGYTLDSRFGKAQDWISQIEEICGRSIWHTIDQVEPIGPRDLLDVLVVAPCTGNTLGKLAHGITDTSVTMACKASLRNHNPLILAVSTNDALGASARNVGTLMNARNVYFVPMRQDDPLSKEMSAVADFAYLPAAIREALLGRQQQPVWLG